MAWLAALVGDQILSDENVAVYKARCEYVLNRLNQIDGLRSQRPDGAFYLFPNCGEFIGKITPEGKTIANDADFVLYLLEHAGVASIHGGAYGLEPYFRISIATSLEILEMGCDRIAKACRNLK